MLKRLTYIEVDTETLSGLALDYCVELARAEQDDEFDMCRCAVRTDNKLMVIMDGETRFYDFDAEDEFSPSTNSVQGNRVMEQENLHVEQSESGDWWSMTPSGKVLFGKTALEAALRGYVQSILGDKIEIPNCLITLNWRELYA